MSEFPVLLQSRVFLFEKHFSELIHPLKDVVKKLLLVSEFAIRHTEILKSLLENDDCARPVTAADYRQLLSFPSLYGQSVYLFERHLRQFRHRYFLRLLLREMGGLATTTETMTAWSDCADVLILAALEFCKQELSSRYGQACEETTGKPAHLYVLAMGKLGGRELNYSSDIDLIMVFSASGHTSGPEKLSNQSYYTKLVQLFIQIMQSITVDGFVFRVDLRLRPNGESGALVSSLTALETYYQEQGRDWERYAMVKARLVNESTAAPDHWFNHLIIPFVYRRYVDFSVIESLRSMKTMIEREIQINPRLDDIKRGFGGIREVEFIIQNIQLIRGGRLPALRQQSTLKALEAVQREKLLSGTRDLKRAYLFLRKLENCLQSDNDQQTHALPADPRKQASITIAMGYDSWGKLIGKLHQVQNFIGRMFRLILQKVDNYEDSERLLANQLSSLWQGQVENTLAINLLASLGFQKAERCYQLIHAFRQEPRCRRLSQAARIRLDRFMVLLLKELVRINDTESVLLQVIQLLENIVGRSAYLALLTENPKALEELLFWFGHSSFISSLLVAHPFLLEVLLDQERGWLPSSRDQLREQLETKLAGACDKEQQEEILRQFKLRNWLLVARAERHGYIDAIRGGRFLSDVAEVIVRQVVALATIQLSERYPEIIAIKSRFALIAYGKLGSREMNYNSDLDLVFIHDAKPEEESLITRLTQKILHRLTTRLRSGILYDVDTRLRPSGEAGLLVSRLAAFVEYQKTHAWTWEHQALVRGRILFGNRRVTGLFQELKQTVFSQKRSIETVRMDIQEMRKKIVRHVTGQEIKYAPGGLLDLEFLVQFLILAHPQPGYSRYTNTLSLLRLLLKTEIISQTHFDILKQAYQHYHYLLHQQLLQPSFAAEWAEEQANVLLVCQTSFTNSPYKS